MKNISEYKNIKKNKNILNKYENKECCKKYENVSTRYKYLKNKKISEKYKN